MNIITATAVNATVAQPTHAGNIPIIYEPMTFGFAANNRMTAIRGTASSPFTTALQNRKLSRQLVTEHRKAGDIVST